MCWSWVRLQCWAQPCWVGQVAVTASRHTAVTWHVPLISQSCWAEPTCLDSYMSTCVIFHYYKCRGKPLPVQMGMYCQDLGEACREPTTEMASWRVFGRRWFLFCTLHINSIPAQCRCCLGWAYLQALSQNCTGLTHKHYCECIMHIHQPVTFGVGGVMR